MNKKRNYKKKRGVALLITLAIIAAITQLVYLTFVYLEKTTKKSNEITNLIQANITIKNVEELLVTALKDINSSEELLPIYQMPITLSANEENAKITLLISANSNVININNLIDNKNETNETYRLILDNIFLTYTIDNPHLLMDYILDTIDKDDVARGYQSEIKEINPLFSDGGIINIKHFKKILDYYYQRTDDKKVFLIPWEKYIGFDNKEIDFNFISPELLMVLNSSISEYEAKELLNGVKFYKKLEEINLEKDIIETLKKLPIVFFNLSFHCSGVFSNGEDSVEFSFDYDKKNKVNKFEIFN